MALTKSQRIKILLAIDGIFFLIELITGYAVHSLALVADSFHMLNDVFSLFIALWAVQAASRKSSTTYTYGWQRAETLGALVNGVFLVALCATIAIEAVQRFVQIEEVTNPQIILIVGACGLASNICGLFLFHDHSHGGHSHGHDHGGHGHSHGDDLDAAEAGLIQGSTAEMADESANPASALPQIQTGAWSAGKTSPKQHIRIQEPKRENHSSKGSHSHGVAIEELNKNAPHDLGSDARASSHRRGRSSTSRSRAHSAVEEIPIHPASFRQSIIQDSQRENNDSEPNSDDERGAYVDDSDVLTAVNESTPLITNGKANGSDQPRQPSLSNHAHHKHAQPKKAGKEGGHGHSHADLNMRGVFLHVMGDALGNIGVIATALFIWKTNFWWRFYFDPMISLLITVIILCSAIPLCKAASRILLQGVPAGLDLDDIKDDIMTIPHISSCHHLHVWQLSDTKFIASLHVRVTFQFEGEGSQRYMAVARQIRQCLHEYGIHSSTIQPEFCCEATHGHKVISSREHTDDEDTCDDEMAENRRAAAEDTKCLLDCGDDCGDGAKCCDPPSTDAGKKGNGGASSH